MKGAGLGPGPWASVLAQLQPVSDLGLYRMRGPFAPDLLGFCPIIRQVGDTESQEKISLSLFLPSINSSEA